MTAINAEVGTPLWGVNKLRADALGALLDDLLALERSGLKEEKCIKVQHALGRLTNAATGIPDGSFWKRQVWKEFEIFEKVYFTWNSIEGERPENIAQRRAYLRKLRKRRSKIATRIRKNQYVIQNEIDLQVVKRGYEALGDLTEALPEIFTNLAKAVGRFGKKGL